MSGKFKGRKLSAVAGLKVRPTSDKLKAAIFNILYSLGIGDMTDKAALDIFAGTGALGIEALSRGAKSCCFIDSAADAIKVIKKNILSVGIGDRAETVFKNYAPGIKMLAVQERMFDVIFMDPPYKKFLTTRVIENIYDYRVFSENCCIVAEHGVNEELPETIKSFSKVTEKHYGDKVLSFYSPKH